LLVDRLSGSTVPFYGYAIGGAVAVAATIDSACVEPIVEATQVFPDAAILGHPDVDSRMRQAVSSRSDLIDVVREIITAKWPIRLPSRPCVDSSSMSVSEQVGRAVTNALDGLRRLVTEAP
jgi:hypothetical protein